jgi:hypothetical protein
MKGRRLVVVDEMALTIRNTHWEWYGVLLWVCVAMNGMEEALRLLPAIL